MWYVLNTEYIRNSVPRLLHLLWWGGGKAELELVLGVQCEGDGVGGDWGKNLESKQH